MADLLSDFLENPSGETLRGLRDVLIAEPGFDFFSTELSTVEELVEEEDFEGVLARVDAMMPEWFLSPSAHQYAADAAREEGEEDRADIEEYVVKACLRGLLESGDGSPERPYLVTHFADEYDLLEALGKTPEEHRTETVGEATLDVIRCSDGAAIHFEFGDCLLSPKAVETPRRGAENF